jgi:nucleotide-binding universal stress UspA family protein
MFRKIVVGSDGSETANAAVALAADLARQSGGELHLVTAMRSSGGVAVPPAVSAADPGAGAVYRREAAQQMHRDVIKGLQGIDVRSHVEGGAPADVIVKWADEVGADLIVVGSKGMQGPRRILGSVPNTVAHGAGCDVLIAKTV